MQLTHKLPNTSCWFLIDHHLSGRISASLSPQPSHYPPLSRQTSCPLLSTIQSQPMLLFIGSISASLLVKGHIFQQGLIWHQWLSTKCVNVYIELTWFGLLKYIFYFSIKESHPPSSNALVNLCLHHKRYIGMHNRIKNNVANCVYSILPFNA